MYLNQFENTSMDRGRVVYREGFDLLFSMLEENVNGISVITLFNTGEI